MDVKDLPEPLAQLCRGLGDLAGVEAVTLGGSRAAGTADRSSDWDVGVYYRGAVDLAPLAAYGEVHAPGAWGRIMNGGAWLTLGGLKVDVMLRDLDVALYWSGQARLGLYEVDALLGYLAGVPTYSLMAELALNRVVRGRLPAVGEYPDQLARAGARRWPSHATFSLGHARMRAERGDVVGAVGHAAKAVVETAHGLACGLRLWALNEKKLIERTGLQGLHTRFTDVPASPPALVGWMDEFRAAIESRVILVERLYAPSADALGALVAESEAAGSTFVRRLVEEWQSGANRFDRPGEALFGARVEGRLVGVCGLNVDPHAGDDRVGRVRHLYVLRPFRRRGVGRRLVTEVVEVARERFVRLHLRTTNPEAARLYESLEFRKSTGAPHHSHVLVLGTTSIPRMAPPSS